MISTFPTKQEVKYSAHYAANAYLDSLLSIPIIATKAFYDISGTLSETISGKRSGWTDWDSVKTHTPFYNKREKIREKWDTLNGVLYFKSSIVGTAIYFASSAFAAEEAYSVLQHIIPQNTPVLKELTTSLATVLTGYIIGNGMIMADYAFVSNRKEFIKDGKRDWKKTLKTAERSIEAAFQFDKWFFGFKLIAQTYMLTNGIDPAMSSVYYDAAGGVVWQSVVFHINMRKGVIKSKSMPEYFRLESSWADKAKDAYRRMKEKV